MSLCPPKNIIGKVEPSNMILDCPIRLFRPLQEAGWRVFQKYLSYEHERVIARRILLELLAVFKKKRAPILVNLGIGIPALISSVGAEEDVSDFIITILESGPWGGLALSGNDFGLAISPFALSTIPDVFSNLRVE